MDSIPKEQALAVAFVTCFLAFSFGLSTPSDSLLLRFAVIGLLAAVQYGFIVTFPAKSEYADAPYALVGLALTAFFHAVDYLVVLRASSGAFVKSRGKTPTLFKQYIQTPLGLLCNQRRLGTPWQITKVPPFSRSNPSAVPSRFVLILRRLLYISVGVAIIDILSGSTVDMKGRMQQRALFSRLDQVTTDELVFRAVVLFKFLTSAIIGVYVGYAIITVVCLALGLSSPAECPPHFGRVSEACSIRGYWGDFYHQGLRRAICGPSDAFVDHVLCLRRGTLPSRYLRLTLAFSISGFIHGGSEAACGVPASERGQFFFFFVQAFGIMFEDAVKGLYKRLGVSMNPSLEKFIGYCWVASWLFWCAPYWAYPSLQYAEPRPSQLRPILEQLIMRMAPRSKGD